MEGGHLLESHNISNNRLLKSEAKGSHLSSSEVWVAYISLLFKMGGGIGPPSTPPPPEKT
jgi:hypothetical protein